MNKEEKIIIAGVKALGRIDPKVLSVGLLVALGRSHPALGTDTPQQRVRTVLAAMGLMQSVMDDMKKKDVSQNLKEKPDSAFSEEDKERAQEILAAFMERSGVHLKQ